MKQLLLIGLAFIAIKSKAQSISYNDLQSGDAKGKYTEYVSKSGAIFKAGERIKIGQPKSGSEFIFITMGDGILLPISKYPSSGAGTEPEIKKITVTGSKRLGYKANVICKGNVSTINIDIENAIDAKEVIIPEAAKD